MDLIVELSIPQSTSRFSPAVLRVVRILRILRIGRVLRLIKVGLCDLSYSILILSRVLKKIVGGRVCDYTSALWAVLCL